ncbi:MAG TPA: PEP-CTERM sorting domain-containing protein, partial [Rhodanobacteraceae bacterium]
TPYAQATPVQIGFNGAMGSGHASLTVVTDTTGAEPAGPSDPAGAQLITDASGTFTNSTFGNVTITGVLARNFATPFDMQPGGSWQPGDLPFPASFSQLVATGGTGGVVTYDDLFYAGGSPQSCWDYPFFGGFLDTYGVMFSLSNGGYLDLWSFGVVAPDALGPGTGGLTYGMAVMQLNSEGGYDVLAGPPFATASVPEPNFLWLFGAAVLGLFAWRRSTETRKRVSHTA